MKPQLRKMYVRSTPRTRQALKRVMAEISEVDSEVTQEIVVTATWLMLEQLKAPELAKQLGPYIAEVKKLLEEHANG